VIQSSLTIGLKFYQDNFKEFHALLGPNGDKGFEDKLAIGFNQRFQELVPLKEQVEAELVRISTISISMNILKYWVFHQEIPNTEITKVMKNLMIKGPLGYLRKLRK